MQAGPPPHGSGRRTHLQAPYGNLDKSGRWSSMFEPVSGATFRPTSHAIRRVETAEAGGVGQLVSQSPTMIVGGGHSVGDIVRLGS